MLDGYRDHEQRDADRFVAHAEERREPFQKLDGPVEDHAYAPTL